MPASYGHFATPTSSRKLWLHCVAKYLPARGHRTNSRKGVGNTRTPTSNHPPHPDTSPFPQPATPRYPPPMQPANKALNQHTPAPWRAAPASSASTTTSGSAPNSRGVVSHGRKNWDKDFIAKTNTPATTTPPKQPPATPAPQSNLPATTPAPWCVAPAWSTAMVKAGSSSNRRGCLYSAKKIFAL